MAPTEREILEARLILAKADQKGKKKIPKASKGRSGKENMLDSLEARSKKKQPVAIRFVFLLSFMFYNLIFYFLDGQSLNSIT
jgi:hypothetical protein